MVFTRVFRSSPDGLHEGLVLKSESRGIALFRYAPSDGKCSARGGVRGDQRSSVPVWAECAGPAPAAPAPPLVPRRLWARCPAPALMVAKSIKKKHGFQCFRPTSITHNIF